MLSLFGAQEDPSRLMQRVEGFKEESEMKKKNNKFQKQAWKNSGEARFEQMVGEYQRAKAELDAMEKGTPEHAAQQKLCDTLFSNAERFFKQHQ